MSQDPNAPDNIDTLLDQLKNTQDLSKTLPTIKEPLKKDEVEAFVIKNAGALIEQSLDVMKLIKDYVSASPNSEEVASLANLITATSSAIETLNKLVIVDRKSATMIKLKELDAKQKQEQLVNETGSKLLLTREDVFKKLLERTDAIIDLPPLSGN